MHRKIRVGAVSYLNTKPLIYGFEQGMMVESIELVIDYPSNIALSLLNDEIDVGLVPVAIIPEIKNSHVVSDYCIGSDGEVASVCLFSDVPIYEIKQVLLDYQSRTSIALVKLLLEDYWNVSPTFEKAGIDFRQKIKGSTGAVVIGDRAFEQRKISKYSYDLGLAWKLLTGLPFVFAAWVSNKPLQETFLANFNEANDFGLQNIDKVVIQNPYSLFNLKDYYSKFITYRLQADMRLGMNEFLKRMTEKSGNQIPFFK